MALPCFHAVFRRVIAAASAVVVTGALVAVPAHAAEGDYSFGKGEFLSGSVGEIDLASILEIEPAVALNRGESQTATSTARLNVRALETVELRLEDALQVLPDNGFVSLGAVNQFAQAASGGSSRAASGAVNDSGAIALGGTNAWPANASLNLGGLVGADVADALADLRLEVGAVSATAEQRYAGEPVGEYQIADLRLELDSAVVAGVATAVGDAVGVVEDALTGLTGAEGVLAGVLQTVSGITGLVGSEGVTIEIEAELLDAVAPLLDQSIGDGVVEIDLAAGTVSVDLAALVNGDNGLNELPVGTELLSAEVVAEIVERVGDLLDGLINDVVDTVETVLESAQLTVASTSMVN